jgi:hypothetical protein
MLFDSLPQFPPALPDDELACLNRTTAQPPGEWDLLDWEEWKVAQRLERRGLLKISRCDGELWAQRTPAATLRLAN